MRAVLSNVITIDRTDEVMKFCEDNLVIDNPEYLTKLKLGKWIGNTPSKLYLYERRGDKIVVPFGCKKHIERILSMYRVGLVYERLPDAVLLRGYKYNSNIELFPYQQEVCEAMLRAGNGIIVMPCGSGKTQTALEVVARLCGKTLWLTHTQDLLNQSMNRAKECFNCDKTAFGTITAGKVNISNGITFATVQTMCKLDLSQYRTEWDTIIVDECLPANTKILTKDGQKALKSLQNGDIIVSYNRESKKLEYKSVTHLFKFKAHDIVKVKLENGKEITATANHPFYTSNDKWIDAGQLRSGDYVMQLLWERDNLEEPLKDELLPQSKQRMGLLLQGMCNESGETKRCVDTRTKTEMFGNNETNEQKVSRCVCGEDERKQSYETAGCESESVCTTERDWSSPQNTMWEWGRNDSSATRTDDSFGEKSDRSLCGISDTNETAEEQWISNLLQSGYSDTDRHDCDRSGRKFTHSDRETGARQEERQFFEWVRVDCVEVQEQTSDGTFDGLCEDGYVYNIEVEDNNNYFADGVLVHNCQHCCGTPTKVTQFYKVINSLYAMNKFGLTATPKRSDGLDKSMYALLGDVIIEIDKEQVAEKTCEVRVETVETGYFPDVNDVLNGDGTINYTSLTQNLIDDEKRFQKVMTVINNRCKSYSMVLANRVSYLQEMQAGYFGKSVCISTLGTSKQAKEERKEALRKLNDGEIDCIFATYQLAAEGLDCPNLKYVVFATPEKNERTVTQAVGRVARKADGKQYGTVIDFVDDFGMYKGWSKKRLGYYKKLGCKFV